jgi:S-adenosylmethionine decarboxylase
VTSQVRLILAELTGDSWPLRAGLDTPLLRDGIGLDSLRGAMLLTRVRGQFGVDVAGEDLNLDAMATIGTLAAFISRRVASGRAAGCSLRFNLALPGSARVKT